MTVSRIALKSVVHYLRRNLAVLAGVSLSTAVIVGALLAGDTVRSSLVAYNTSRLGDVRYVLDAGERTVTGELADSLTARIDPRGAAVGRGSVESELPDPTVALRIEPVMHIEAVVSNPESGIELTDVHIYGVRDSLWSMLGSRRLDDETTSGDAPPVRTGAGIAVLNEAAAGRLGITGGEELILRTYPFHSIPGDAPVTTERRILRIPVEIGGVVQAGEGGNFALAMEQGVPLNVFLDFEFLTRELGIPGRCNLLLANGGVGDGAVLTEAIRDVWTLDDLDLSLETFPEAGFIELRSSRIFIDSTISAVAVAAMPAAYRAYTYFVNTIQSGDASIPYSFVSVRPDLRRGEIALSEWARNDLSIDIGEEVSLVYFVPSDSGGLVEAEAEFRMVTTVPDRIAADLAEAIPEYPGIAGVDHCLEWRPGIPLQLHRIRERDERFWNRYGGAPKAFISLEDADRLWGGRFGNGTAVRFPPGIDRTPIVRKILEEVSPASIGLEFRDVYTPAVRAGMNSVDFSGLFLALSFFIVAASVILTTLLFGSELHSRRDQLLTMARVGFPRSKVCKTAIIEGAVVTLCAVPVGMIAGIGYVALLTGALRGVWAGALGRSPGELTAAGMALSVTIRQGTIALGGVSGYVLGMVSVVIGACRAVARIYPDLTDSTDANCLDEADVSASERGAEWALYGGVAALSIGLLLPVAPLLADSESTAAFVVAGMLTMVGGLLLFFRILLFGSRRNRTEGFGLLQLGFGFAANRRGRTLASAAVIALGIFTVVAVGMNRKGLPQDPDNRATGTGGFDLFIRSTLPIHEELASILSVADGQLSEVVPFRLRKGDDASCLNLNQVRRPGILGVDSETLAAGERFSFQRVEYGDPVIGATPFHGVDSVHSDETASVWRLLQAEFPDGSIPAVADQTVITWGLQLRTGDTLEIAGEDGTVHTLRIVAGLAASVFQGYILVDIGRFTRMFPSAGGAEIFLVDMPSDSSDEPGSADLIRTLERRYRDHGIMVEEAAYRLARFNVVENSYLSIFLILGAVGMAVGTIGMSVIAVRNIREDRSRLALLSALGYRKRQIRVVVNAENLAPFLAGYVLGTVAAVTAIMPRVTAEAERIDLVVPAMLLGGVLLWGILWIVSVTNLMLRGPLASALRDE